MKLNILKSRLFINIYAIIFIIIAFLITLFYFKPEPYSSLELLKIAICVIEGILFIIFTSEFTNKLRNMIALKYKVIKDKYRDYEIKYLTSAYLFIPFWKKAFPETKFDVPETNFEFDDSPFLFPGSTFPMVFTYNKKFENKTEVENAVREHKEKLKENINYYLEPPKKKRKEKYYL